ncbi:TRAP transporter small permease subunit [Hwanghaeella grinnelliae]|uniref:TRAP transporter small permease protein n=1 Tax=Hwanghaeella grinnelliae TaxID=2500179 RepID=A0A3S2Y027_9PROT|nr:TRAP transporter small permease subunit [Hwanghaeella grinnelliae]RVU33818.1 TRAP transporter small permease subunit [Hwanghaeella grinnelliae]
MSIILKMANYIDVLPRRIGMAGGWLILPLIAIIMFDVVTRKIDFLRIGMSELSWYWLIEPIKLQDLEWHLHGVLLLLSFGFGYLVNAHVRVDIFREKLTARSQAKVELFGLLVFAVPYLLTVLYYAWIFVHASYTQGEGSESLTGIPVRWIVKSFTIYGFTLAFLAVLTTMIRLCAYLWGGPEMHRQARDDLQIFAIDDDHEGHQGHSLPEETSHTKPFA